MANTTYFGWETPDDTDLVKDGAAAIRTLGQAIDTSMQDLEGGTTGQILSKNSNADMDFVWVTNDVGDITEVVAGTGLSGGGSSGSVTLTNTVATEFDAKGDLVVGTGADTFDKLSAGTNDHRLVAASGETTGLKYVADTQNTVIDAEGDLLVGDSADTLQRLAIGSNTHVLTVDTSVDGKIKWAAAAGGGKVLQVVQASVTTTATNTTTTFADSNLTASITPTLATSKILVIVNQSMFNTRNPTGIGERGCNVRLVRGSTTIVDYTLSGDGGFSYSRIRCNNNEADRNALRFIQPITYLDSPATTSSTTYKTTFNDAFGNQDASTSCQPSSLPSTITLLEIGV
jgi:hypothetical protein